jgi:hypothetical protein
MRKYLIKRSKEATGREKSWDSETYETIAWKHFGESLGKLSLGRKIQISKYTNDLLPTARQIQTLDNQMDGQCLDANYYGKPQLTSSRAPARPVDLHGWPLEKHSNRSYHDCTLLM